MVVYKLRSGEEGLVAGIKIPKEGFCSKYRVPALEDGFGNLLQVDFIPDPPIVPSEGMSVEEKDILIKSGKLIRKGVRDDAEAMDKSGKPPSSKTPNTFRQLPGSSTRNVLPFLRRGR